MGVYIKNMEMPKCCGKCPLIDYETLECKCGGIRDKNCYNGIYDNCPLIEILIEIPSIYAEWKINSDGYYPYCSNCKQEPQGREMTDFCPNCGADMRKKNDL